MSKSASPKKAVRNGHAEPSPGGTARPARARQASPAATVGEETASRWTFLTNHAHVLALIYSDPDAVLRRVAAEVGITERAVQRIIQDLEEGGFIERQKVGRQNHYRVITSQSLRHPIEAHRNIGDLLDLINK